MNSYEIVNARDLKIGDNILGTSTQPWNKKYTIVELISNNGYKLLYKDIITGEPTKISWWPCESEYRRELTELPYDPTQQGDTDDDI